MCDQGGTAEGSTTFWLRSDPILKEKVDNDRSLPLRDAAGGCREGYRWLQNGAFILFDSQRPPRLKTPQKKTHISEESCSVERHTQRKRVLFPGMHEHTDFLLQQLNTFFFYCKQLLI